MKNTNGTKRKPELMQFVRSKGKMVPLILEDGTVARTDKGKVKMVREKGLPRGILVAGMVNGKVRIGWSYVNKKLGDSFNKERGMDIAVGRMIRPSHIEHIPHAVMRELDKSFIPRCEQYFAVDLSEK